MARHRPGRHAPAFLLMALHEGPSYGLEILQRLTHWVPEHRMDSAIVYRTLRRLEEDGLVSSSLDDTAAGPVRRVYAITEEGIAAMDDLAREIRCCVANLSVLLERYERRNGQHPEPRSP